MDSRFITFLKLFCWMFFLLRFIWFLRAVSRDSWYCQYCKLLEEMVHVDWVNELVLFLACALLSPHFVVVKPIHLYATTFQKGSEHCIHRISVKKFHFLFMCQFLVLIAIFAARSSNFCVFLKVMSADGNNSHECSKSAYHEANIGHF